MDQHGACTPGYFDTICIDMLVYLSSNMFELSDLSVAQVPFVVFRASRGA